MHEPSSPPDHRLPWALLPPVAVWQAMTVLRESQLFWRDAGGYPVWLRDFVLDAYWPFTGALLLAFALGVARIVAGRTGTIRRSAALGWLAVAAALGGGLAYAGANNLANLMDGRPLHAHPGAAEWAR